MRCVVLAVLVAACGKREAAEATGPGSAGRGSGSGVGSSVGSSAGSSAGASAESGSSAGPAMPCEPLPFAVSAPVPEASGAAWLTIDGVLSLVVVSDSGNDGAYAVLDPDTGATLSTGKLPLGSGASDDVEGVAARDGRIYGLTSSGAMRVWQRTATGFELVDGPYPIGTGDFVCEPATKTNCKRDYEGLALAPVRPDGADACVGFACSRKDGAAYCLVEQTGKLHVDPARSIAIDRKGVLADCAFSDTGTLLVANNLLGLSAVRRIDGWADPKSARVVDIGELGTGFPEVVAARGDVIYRMSDTGGAPSLLSRFRCKP